MNTVLLYEPNAYHYEVIPGFTSYFLELGYNIDILCHQHDNDGNEFSLVDLPINKVHIHYYQMQYGYKELKELLETNTYDFIFISSFDFGINNRIHSIYSIIKEIDNTQYGIIGCYHAMSSLEVNQEEYLIRNNRIITLSEVTYQGHKFNNISPITFNNTYTPSLRKNAKCQFASIGISNDFNELCHSFNEVIENPKNEGILNIIGNIGWDTKSFRRSQFKRRIGYPLLSLLQITKYADTSYKPYKRRTLRRIHLLGRLPFEKMYQTILDSDFIIININPRLGDEFYTNRTSGSKNLAIGFTKPCIIERKYADYYGFNESNSIIYDEGNLPLAIEQAIKMSDLDYIKLCQEMNKMYETVYMKSLTNLKQLITNINKQGKTSL